MSVPRQSFGSSRSFYNRLARFMSYYYVAKQVLAGSDPGLMLGPEGNIVYDPNSFQPIAQPMQSLMNQAASIESTLMIDPAGVETLAITSAQQLSSSPLHTSRPMIASSTKNTAISSASPSPTPSRITVSNAKLGQAASSSDLFISVSQSLVLTTGMMTARSTSVSTGTSHTTSSSSTAVASGNSPHNNNVINLVFAVIGGLLVIACILWLLTLIHRKTRERKRAGVVDSESLDHGKRGLFDSNHDGKTTFNCLPESMAIPYPLIDHDKLLPNPYLSQHLSKDNAFRVTTPTPVYTPQGQYQLDCTLTPRASTAKLSVINSAPGDHELTSESDSSSLRSPRITHQQNPFYGASSGYQIRHGIRESMRSRSRSPPNDPHGDMDATDEEVEHVLSPKPRRLAQQRRRDFVSTHAMSSPNNRGMETDVETGTYGYKNFGSPYSIQEAHLPSSDYEYSLPMHPDIRQMSSGFMKKKNKVESLII